MTSHTIVHAQHAAWYKRSFRHLFLLHASRVTQGHAAPVRSKLLTAPEAAASLDKRMRHARSPPRNVAAPLEFLKTILKTIAAPLEFLKTILKTIAALLEFLKTIRPSQEAIDY